MKNRLRQPPFDVLVICKLMLLFAQQSFHNMLVIFSNR